MNKICKLKIKKGLGELKLTNEIENNKFELKFEKIMKKPNKIQVNI